MKTQLLRLVFLFALFAAPAASHSALVLSYSVTNNSIGSGFASGSILDSTNTIGSWSITNFSFTVLDPGAGFTASVGTIASNTAGNSYLKPGIGILMSSPTGAATNGVMTIQYTVSASLNAGYTLDSASFWGKYPNTVGQYGPALPSGDGGSISLSGFAGTGTVSDPNDKLQIADGYNFTSGENLGGWITNTVSVSAANVQWQLTAPAAASYTFTLDYTGQPLSSANEGTAFNFNISPAAGVPEPGTWAAGALLMAGAVLWQYRRRRAA